MTRVCSRNLTQRPAFGGDDNAFPTCGLRIKVRRFWWVTLSEHKWVILGERRGLWLILHKGVRYEARGPAVTARARRTRTARMIRDLPKAGCRGEGGPLPAGARAPAGSG